MRERLKTDLLFARDWKNNFTLKYLRESEAENNVETNLKNLLILHLLKVCLDLQLS
jgi:hypothetical protein